jgi:D-3-phosphoglycerate dehydrogenase / 2-oxoglutarate reductase
VIGRIGVGMDNIDVPAARTRGIVVCYAAEENAVSVAEHVFALLLALARKVPSADRSVREGRWERAAHTGFELHGKTLAVLGLGRIGFRVAPRARAFGMRVLAYDPVVSSSSPAATESGAELVSLEAALAEADVVSVHASWTLEATARVPATVAGDVDRVLRGEPALHFWNLPTPRKRAV